MGLLSEREADNLIARIKASRAERGLIIRWKRDTGQTFTQWPHDDTQKQQWIAAGKREGWELLP